MEVHRGEVFYADLSPVVGSEQGGVRPVLIVQNEIGNRHSPTVIAAAITSRLDKARLPTHINIRAADTGLAKDSVVLLEQIRTLDKHRLRERAGQITPEDQKREMCIRDRITSSCIPARGGSVIITSGRPCWFMKSCVRISFISPA